MLGIGALSNGGGKSSAIDGGSEPAATRGPGNRLCELSYWRRTISCPHSYSADTVPGEDSQLLPKNQTEVASYYRRTEHLRTRRIYRSLQRSQRRPTGCDHSKYSYCRIRRSRFLPRKTR